MERPCANGGSGPPLIDGRSQTAKSSTIRNSPSQTASGLSAGAPPPTRIMLPTDLPRSLRYLDDVAFRRLLEAVTVEINRQNQKDAKNKGAIAPMAGTSGKGASVSVSDKTTREIDELPEGKANLIRASFRAGIKPVAIARTFRISQSLVNRVLNSIEKPKR